MRLGQAWVELPTEGGREEKDNRKAAYATLNGDKLVRAVTTSPTVNSSTERIPQKHSIKTTKLTVEPIIRVDPGLVFVEQFRHLLHHGGLRELRVRRVRELAINEPWSSSGYGSRHVRST